jgi:thiamine biosynthesis protein ThiS
VITVNGDQVEYAEDSTVATVIEQLGFKFPLLVVRINGKLIERDAYGSTAVADGDSLDVIHLMSGG